MFWNNLRVLETGTFTMRHLTDSSSSPVSMTLTRSSVITA